MNEKPQKLERLRTLGCNGASGCLYSEISICPPAEAGKVMAGFKAGAKPDAFRSTKTIGAEPVGDAENNRILILVGFEAQADEEPSPTRAEAGRAMNICRSSEILTSAK